VFQKTFEYRTYELFLEKLNIESGNDPEKIKELFYKCIEFLQKSKHPFEEFFHKTAYWLQNPKEKLSEILNHPSASEIETLLKNFKSSASKPLFLEEKPQTMLIDEVEAIWAPIAEKDDWSAFDKKINSLTKPV